MNFLLSAVDTVSRQRRLLDRDKILRRIHGEFCTCACTKRVSFKNFGLSIFLKKFSKPVPVPVYRPVFVIVHKNKQTIDGQNTEK